jgi:hypothetical protein
VAVAVLGEVMVIVLEVEPEPEASPVHPEKTYWVPTSPDTMLDNMIAWVELPLLYHPEPVAVPYPPLFTVR